MSDEQVPLQIGQFSESPVLSVARALGLDRQYGVDWATQRVPSSPAQFGSLVNGEIDIAITSPDNVMLYASTDKNPLGQQLDLEFLRPIDRGLGLALYADPGITQLEDFQKASLGVDVMSSGFALLLLGMLDHLHVDRTSIRFQAVGATPLRLEAILSGEIQGSVLNAETAVAASEAGLTRWATSRDVSDKYLGTVLAQLKGGEEPRTRAFVDMWDEATRSIIELRPEDLAVLLEAQTPHLANEAYIELLQSPDFGCIVDDKITLEQLQVLAHIRSQASAFTPSEAALEALAQ